MPRIGTSNDGREDKCRLNDITTQKIYDVLLIGGSIKDACVLAGITQQTYQNWMERGRTAVNIPKYQKYRDFALKVEECFHKDKLRCLTNMQRSGQNDWKQWQARLKQKCPEEYGELQRIQIDIQASQKEILDAAQQEFGKDGYVRLLERLTRRASEGGAHPPEDEHEEIDR